MNDNNTITTEGDQPSVSDLDPAESPAHGSGHNAGQLTQNTQSQSQSISGSVVEQTAISQAETDASLTTAPKRSRVHEGNKWYRQYFIFCPDGSVKCTMCQTQYGWNTSAGTHKYHLEHEHKITKPMPSSVTVPTGGSKGTLKAYIDKEQQSKLDASIAKYILVAGLSHSHVENTAFCDFIQESHPGHQMMSRKTMRKRIFPCIWRNDPHPTAHTRPHA
jgi:hypothetical protein